MTATISRHWRLRAIRLMAVSFATLLAPAGHAQPTPPTTEAPTSTPSASTKATTTMTREEWEKAIARVPQGKEGCFKATYPHLEWQEVPCATPPKPPVFPWHTGTVLKRLVAATTARPK
jgi:hypothetical protein